METAERENRVRFLSHKGRRVLLLDFTAIDEPDQALGLIEHARQFVARQAPASLFTLTDISGSNYNRKVTEALMELGKHNKPFVIAGGAVGVTGLSKVVFKSILAFSGRTNIQLFDTREAALDWLAAYAG